MKQVYFITDDRMTAMLWKGENLIAKYEFSQNASELMQMLEYLDESKDIPAYIIVDVLEEEVTLTSIPHVSSRDRKFLIERAKTKLFRSSDFCTASIVGREQYGRKDDQLLVSGLTTDRSLLKWLNLILDKDVTVAGIYSLPLISANILKLAGIKRPITLLLSRQSQDFIRQSVFKDGKLIYSRNIPSAFDFSLSTVINDLRNTKKYLQNQRFLNFDERINVIVLASDVFYQQLHGLDESVSDMDVTYIKHEQIEKSLGIKANYKVGGREIFASLLMKSNVSNHYARKSDTKKHATKVNCDRFNIATLVAVFVIVVLCTKLYLDSGILDKSMEGLDSQVVSLTKQNNKKENELKKLPAEANKMKIFVKNMEQIDGYKKTSIDSVLTKISQVITHYEQVSIQSLNWYASAYYYEKSLDKREIGKFRKSNKSKKSIQLLEIEASIENQALTQKQTQALVEQLLESVESQESVAKVTLIKQPVKVSSKLELVGAISNAKKNKALFTFTIQFLVDDNVG